MKLANHLGIRLTGLFVILFLIWSVIYAWVQMYEIYDGIDEGLTNLKQEFIVQANRDARFVENMEQYNPINMIVREISSEDALDLKEEHSTTKVYFDTEKEFEEVRILSTAFKCEANGKYYKLQFFTSTVETEDLIENMLILLAVLWATLSILLFWGSRYIIRQSSKSFHELLAKLGSFNLGQTQMIDFPKTNISEFKVLNKTVEVLLKENIQTYKDQKIFIENASHELQTPLAILISRVDLLMSKEDLSEEQMKELSTILSTLNRMRRLNSSLLLLSKIRNKQFTVSAKVDMGKVVDEVCADFEDIMEHKQISLEVESEDAPVLQMNADLAHIMISNLVKNATYYNVPNGNITISLLSNSLSIANSGMPLPEGIDIFERYKSGNDSDSSAGLGLAIVSSIVDAYHFRVQYKYDQKHIITIFFY